MIGAGAIIVPMPYIHPRLDARSLKENPGLAQTQYLRSRSLPRCVIGYLLEKQATTPEYPLSQWCGSHGTRNQKNEPERS